MLTNDWINFFSVDVGAAVALTGLLFVCFSIYNSSSEIDVLERTFGTAYFLELVASFIIGLAAIAPPHAWWVGAIAISLVQATYLASSLVLLRTYRKSFKNIQQPQKGKAAEPGDQRRSDVYLAHRGQFNAAWIALLEALIVLAAGVVGGIQQLGWIRIPIWPSLPLYLVGLWAGWYLVSSSLGAWHMLFHLTRNTKALS